MSRAVIIGYGNPLRQDDGIGWRAAELAEARLSGRDVEVIRTHQLTPELAVKLEGADTLVFLDAAEEDPPGFVRFQFVHAEKVSAWTHDLSPGELLSLARELYETETTAFLITGGIETMAYGSGLSEAAEFCAIRMATLAAALATPDSIRAAAPPSDQPAWRGTQEYSRPVA